MSEKKEPVKVSMSTFFLIIAIIAIAVMAYFMYSQKTNADKQIDALESDVASMQTKINDLQNAASATTANQTDTNDNISITEEQAKTALSNYLDLESTGEPKDVLRVLTEKGKLSYNSSQDKISNGTITTNVKFSDYKKAMLNFVSKTEFERNWHTSINENKDGYCTAVEAAEGVLDYTVKSITENNDSSYIAHISYYDIDGNTILDEEDVTFTVKLYNGNYVIDSLNR